MKTYLCNTCGKRLVDSIRICPDCGAVNYRNEDVIKDVTKEKSNYHKIYAPVSIHSIVSVLVAGGIICDIASMFLIFNNEYEIFGALTIGGTIAFFIGLFLKHI